MTTDNQGLVAGDDIVGPTQDTPRPAEPTPVPFGLTPRELEIALLMARGIDKHVISDELGISDKTYDTHRGHILKKTNCENAVQLVYALWTARLIEFTR